MSRLGRPSLENIVWEQQKQRSLLYSMRVGFVGSGPTLYVVQGRAKPVLHGPNSTEYNLFHHRKTTYRVG